eukprot:TRINITY_DN7613_c0_g1_i1.p1 TRINITY_DN7613_c0_g1~~TRINITY_DN7613_c0_g1_i1.p1  ORF type:complete len:1168 (+),score=234.42 TRINITY_DN7613_c0_g1_i1:692-4195(+)
MLIFFATVLREWASQRYRINLDHSGLSRIELQPDDLLAEIVERANKSAVEILEEFGYAWLEEIAPRRFYWQLEVMGLVNLKEKRVSLADVATNTGTWSRVVETLCVTFPSIAPPIFWWTGLKRESHNGEEHENGIFHYQEVDRNQISFLPFFVGLFRSIGRMQHKVVDIRYLKFEESENQEIQVDWKTKSEPSIRVSHGHLNTSHSGISSYSAFSPITTSASASASSSSSLSASASTSSSSSSSSMASVSYGIEVDEFCEFFPFHLVLQGDKKLRIVQMGNYYKNNCPSMLGTSLFEHSSLITSKTVYGETTTFDPADDLPVFNAWKLVDKLTLVVNPTSPNICLKGKIKERKKTSQQEARDRVYYYFAKPVIPSSSYHQSKGRERSSSRSGPVCSIVDSDIPSYPPKSFSLPSITSLFSFSLSSAEKVQHRITTSPALGVISDMEIRGGIFHDDLVEELTLQEVTKAFCRNVSPPETIKRNASYFSRYLESSRAKKKDKRNKKKKRERSKSKESFEFLSSPPKFKSLFSSPPNTHRNSLQLPSVYGSTPPFSVSPNNVSPRSSGSASPTSTLSRPGSPRVPRVPPLVTEAVQQQLLEVNKALNAEIEERKFLEVQLATAKNEATAESKATSAFLAHMSHEIRTPLNGILGMTQLLIDSNLDTQQRDIAETIQTSGQQLLTIVNDILDFEKIQAGCLTLEHIGFDLRKVIEESCDMLSYASNTKHLELGINYSHQLPIFVKGDPGRFRQILLNFLNNAIKFTEQGYIKIICSLDEENPPTDDSIAVKITVEDTGIGIPADRLGRLFKSFSQVDSSITRKYGGTGLGLVIAQQLVELMGGKPINVTSTVGVGSAFTFSIPLKIDRESKENKLDLRSRLFLVIEHSEVVRDALIEDLKRHKSDVVMASTISEAEVFLKGSPDDKPLSLIFASAEIARLPGWADFLDKAARKTPVIILSSPFCRNEEFGQKPFLYMTKPIKLHELEYTIMSELGLLSDETKEAITGRRRKSIKLSRKFSTGSYTVLLVDDNPVNLKVGFRLLERLCIKPDCVCSGQEALECAKRKQYDIILMDLQMPGMNGYEATAELRKMERESKQEKPCKVIAITADATTDDRSKCLASGMDDFLSKPLTLEKLADVLDRILFTDLDSPLPPSVEAEIMARIPAHECM